jgi:predicted nuclease of predicted toxin-antitoxin system
MRLLFNQNISFRIIERIKFHFPYATHVRDLGLEFSGDSEIWDFARGNDYFIITLDYDFKKLAERYGHPPTIILLRTYNFKTSELASRILSRKKQFYSLKQNEFSDPLAWVVIDLRN